MDLTSTNSESKIAREYQRVSQDKSGRERSPEEQHIENKAAADIRRWLLGIPYRDIGSASDFSDKTRVEFDQLMADLQDDTFGADILILWSISRGSRRLREWLDLIDLLIQCKVLVYVTAHDRLYNPTSRHDYRAIIDEVMKAEDQAHEISEGVRRAAVGGAVRGEPWGQCPYGYRRIYNERNGKLVRQEEEPEEATVVRELFSRLEANHSLRSIEIDFAARGITTRPRLNKKTGKIETRPFTAQHLRKLALTATYAGIRVHDPLRWGKGHAHPTPDSKETPAQWPALVEMETYLAVRKILTDPSRRTSRDGRAMHLLTGIAVCGVCGSILSATNKVSVGPRYRCYRKGCASIFRKDLDELIESVIIGFLSREDNYSAFTQQSTVELDKVREQLALARAAWDALASSGISLELAALREPAVLARIAELEAEEKTLRVVPALPAGLQPGADIAARWHSPGTPVTARRAAARTVLAPGVLGRLLLLPAPAGRIGVRAPAVQRVAFRRPDGDHSLDTLEIFS
jgi:DNA invertase Pin-like site-specific DNA recombinase